MKRIVVFLVLAAFALMCTRVFAHVSQPPGRYQAFVLSGEIDGTYDARGNQTSGLTTSIFYDRKGELSRTVSSYFTKFFDFEFQYYDTNVLVETNGPFTYVAIDDSINLSNGYPYLIEHAVTTSTNTGNRSSEVTVRTSTTADGQVRQTITTGTRDYSTNYIRDFSEARDTNGNLLSWTLSSWTNDPANSQQYSLYEQGGE
jgi:hypothetical protein